ncbi:MAG: AAA family ATPase [Chloroflexi bacterium]|nr:AAA family ATPase [Chloroflexota bacterium]
MLIAMAGLPGTGKSVIARGLAQALPAVILDKDPIRAALFPASLIEYSTHQDDFCMHVMLQVAEYILRKEPLGTVILDGRTFSRRYQLDAVVELAKKMDQQLAIIECICSEATARERLEQDVAHRLHVADNRNFALYLAIQARFEPIEWPKLVLNTDQDPAQCIARALAYLQPTMGS